MANRHKLSKTNEIPHAFTLEGWLAISTADIHLLNNEFWQVQAAQTSQAGDGTMGFLIHENSPPANCLGQHHGWRRNIQHQPSRQPFDATINRKNNHTGNQSATLGNPAMPNCDDFTWMSRIIRPFKSNTIKACTELRKWQRP